MNKVVKEKKDLTFLEWSKIRQSSGTAGSFLKSYMNYDNKKIYFKLSDYNNIEGIVGHECINEIIIDRLLTILGVEHLNYFLINADILINDNIVNTYICASYDFKKNGESKIAFDTFYELKKEKNENVFMFCERFDMIDYIYQMIVIDYIIMNRDRHGANIEILYDKKNNKYRVAPLFDHGLSLLCKTKDEDLSLIDVMNEKITNSFIGTRFLLDNLKLIPKEKMPRLNKLLITHKEIIFKDLEDIISKQRIEKIWEMIWKRVKYYETLCNQK